MAATFVYKVRDKSGKIINGAIEAENQVAVASKLRGMGYVIIEISEKKEAASFQIAIFRKKIKIKDITVFSRQFATMINAGVSITKALSILAEQTENPTLAVVIIQIQKDVEGGLSLSEALLKHPKVFPPIFVNMTRAGEAGGVLDEVLLRVADHFEKAQALRAKIKAALSYPVAVLSFSLLLVFLMVTFLVPIFADMFSQFGGQLPLPTKVLMVASNIIRSFWWAIGAIMYAIVFAFRRFKSTKFGRYFLDNLKLRMPVAGPLTRKIAISKFSRTFSTLISSGVPILQALDIVADTAENAIVTKAIKEARVSIKEGETISEPLSKSPVFPPMVVQMIAIGEETGALDSMLSKIADFYDEEVTAAVDTLTAVLEPFMMMFLGFSVGGIVIALYLPMFSIITLIK